MSVERRPWDPLDGESSADWDAFRLYRDLPPVERSVAEVARLIGLVPSSVARLRRVANEREWERRAVAYDMHLDAIRLRRREEAMRRRGELDAERVEVGALLVDLARRHVEEKLRAPTTTITMRDALKAIEIGLPLMRPSEDSATDEDAALSAWFDALSDEALAEVLDVLQRHGYDADGGEG